MHRALQIPELLLLTLSQLDLCVFYAPERVKERTALAAAATCTAWKEPALKILWKEMHDVIPLFKLLAPMTCRVLEAPDDCGTYNEWKFTQRAITDEAWNRFQYYAAFIHTLKFEPATNTCLRQVYSTITKSRPIDTNFFPNLRDLDMDNFADPNASLTSLAMLLSDGVRKLRTYISETRIARGIYEIHVPAHLKHIEDLHIAPTFLPAQIIRWLKPHPNLRKLSIGPQSITKSLFRAIGDLARLEELCIAGHILHHSIPKFPQPSSFPFLPSLQLNAILSAWVALLKGGGIPSTLTDIGVCSGFGVEPVWEEDAFVGFFQAVAEEVAWVESIRLELRFSRSPDHIIEFDDIRPLTTCSSLRSLTVYNPSGLSLSKDDLRTLLKAWPALRCFRFYPHTRAARHISEEDRLEAEAEDELVVFTIKGLPFHVLDLFAEFCPEIEELALPFTDADLRVATLDAVAPLTRLKSLDIFKAEMKFPETVAIYLSRRMTPRSVLHWQEYALVDPSALLPPVPVVLLEDFNEWRGIELALKTLFELRRGVVPRAEVGWKVVRSSE